MAGEEEQEEREKMALKERRKGDMSGKKAQKDWQEIGGERGKYEKKGREKG